MRQLIVLFILHCISGILIRSHPNWCQWILVKDSYCFQSCQSFVPHLFQISGYNGLVTCPSYERICGNLTSILDLVDPCCPETTSPSPTTPAVTSTSMYTGISINLYCFCQLQQLSLIVTLNFPICISQHFMPASLILRLFNLTFMINLMNHCPSV